MILGRLATTLLGIPTNHTPGPKAVTAKIKLAKERVEARKERTEKAAKVMAKAMATPTLPAAPTFALNVVILLISRRIVNAGTTALTIPT